MSDETKVGRLLDSDLGKAQTLDNPSQAFSALLSKMDEIIDALVALDAANTGVPEVAAIDKLKFRL